MMARVSVVEGEVDGEVTRAMDCFGRGRMWWASRSWRVFWRWAVGGVRKRRWMRKKLAVGEKECSPGGRGWPGEPGEEVPM